MQQEDGTGTGTCRLPAPSDRTPVVTWVALPIAMGVGPLMLYTLTSVSALVVDDLGLSPVQYGAIATATFLSAGLGSFALGRYADQVRPYRLFVAISLGSGLGIGLVASARAYGLLLTGAIVCGIAQSISNPATNQYISALPTARRGALIGWKQSGVQMSQLVAGLTAPTIALLLGWRIAVASALVVVVLGALVGWKIPYGNRPNTQRRAVGQHTALGPAVWALTIYTFFVGLGLAATNTYLPLYAHDVLGFSVRSAGLTAAVVGLVGLVSRMWWGRLSDTGADPGRTLVLLGCGALAGAAIIALAQPGPSGLVWLGAAIFGASALAANSVTMVSLLKLVPAGSIGAASGVLAAGLYLGFASGPLAFGLVLDARTYELAWALPCAAFAVAALSAALSPRLITPMKSSSVKASSANSARKANHADPRTK